VKERHRIRCVIALASAPEQSEKLISVYGEMLSGLYPFLDGMEHVLEVIEYIEKEDWHSAEREPGKCSADFSKSRDIFVNLKNLEFVEISVPAIEMYVALPYKGMEQVSPCHNIVL